MWNFWRICSEKIPSGVNLITGNYEFLLEYLENNNLQLRDIYDIKYLKVHEGDADKLSLIDWENLILKKQETLY